MMTTDIDKYVGIFGEAWRVVITNSLKWLDEEEPTWNLLEPINKYKFLKELIAGEKYTRDKLRNTK